MKSTLLLSLALTAATALAADPGFQLVKVDKPQLNEEFTGAAIPENWKPGGRAKSFSVVDGALQGVCAADDSHGPAISVPVDAHDFAVRFSVRFVKPGYFLFLADGESQFGGEAHLLRLALSGNQAQIAQDRGSLESKKQQADAKAAAAKAGTKVPAPTKEQLADPKFYRTESLDRKPGKFIDTEWHDVLIEVKGNEVVAQLDGQITLKATGTVLDVPKKKIVFLIGQSGTMQIDHVKFWSAGAAVKK